MPVTLPAGIIALQGQSSTTAPIVLMEWLLPSPQYYSSREAVTWNGHTWEGNRLRDFPSFTLGIFDRKGREFPKLDITLSNLANDGSSAFPIQGLDAAQDLENWPLKIYFYSPDAASGFLRWSGYSGKPKYNGADKSASLSATFIFDSLNIPFPFRTQASLGFGTLDTNQSKSSTQEPMIPIIYGEGPDLAVRLTIYRAWTDGGQLHVNFIVSGCADGQAFLSTDITELKFNGSTPATTIEIGGLGSAGQTAPANLTRFPDGEAHPRVFYGYAAFPIPDELKDSLDSLEPDAIKAWLANGRKLAATGLPSENGVLIIKDILTDTHWGIGLAAGDFDAAAVTAAANYVGTRYRARVELHESEPLMDLIAKMLGDIHCYITFADKIQIRAKGNAEASVATFAAADSGGSGRKIVNDFVETVDEEDSSSLINDLLLNWRRKARHFGHPIHVFDPAAQSFTPGNFNKPTREEIESPTLQYEDEASISGAILVREEQSGNLFHNLKVPFWEGCDIVPGDVITVLSPDIFANGSNYLFRVLTQSFDPNGCQIGLRCKVYKPAIYNDDTAGVGVDLLRGGQDTSQQGRPPDVTPVSLTVTEVVANDTEGKQATLRGVWTYPAVDLAAEQAQGIFREYPIVEVEFWLRYTDESINQARRGAIAKYPTAQADFQIDFFKSRSVECFFVAMGPSRGRSPLGYVPDPTKVTSLTANLAANPAITASVVSTTNFAADDYVQIEKEILKVASKTSNSLTFVSSGGNRTPQFDSAVIAHPTGTQIAVAKLSYPSLTRSLSVPQFGYPAVQNLLAKQRAESVKFHWDDPEADNQEKFYLYVSEDSDANTNAAKLGVNNPAWYLSDPETPPSGVLLFKIDTIHFDVPQEMFAGSLPNTTMWGRVAARNGKRNWSATLSNIANQTSSGHGLTPSFAPSDPAPGDIISLGVPSEIVHKQIPVTFRIWADGADHSKKFDDGGVDRIGYFYAPPSAADPALPDLTRIEKHHQNITDTTQVSANITHWFPLGQKLFWLQNFNSNGSGKTVSGQVTTLTFVPGDYGNDPANLTVFTITATPINDKFTRLDVRIVQPAAGSPVILKNLWFDRQLPTEGYVELSDKLIHLHGDTSFSTLSADFHLFAEAKHPPGLTGINYRARIVAQGGLSRSVSTAANSAADPDVPADTGVPGPGAPGAPTFAKVKKNGTPVRMPLPTTNRNSHSHNLLVIANAAAPANGVTVLTASDLTTGTVLSSANDAAGQIEIGRKKGTVEIDKDGMVAVFGLTTIHFWFYWVNDFGSSARSASLAYNLATGEAGALSADTGVPGPGAPGAPTFAKVKKNGTPVRMPLPTTNRSSHSHNLLVIANAAAPANGVTVLTASDLTTGTVLSSSNDAAGQIEIGRKKGTVEIDKDGMGAVFGLTTIHFWFYWVNDFGLGARSASLSYNLATGEAGALSSDAEVPGNFPTPALKFKRGKLLARMDTAAVTGLQTLKDRVELSIHNGTDSLNLDDPTSEVKVSGIVFYQVGVAAKLLAYDAAQLQRIFGTSANLKSRFKLTNDVGPTTSGDSANLSLSGLRDINAGYSPVNVIRNGHFMYSNGTQAKRWESYRPVDGVFGVLDQTGKIRVDLAGHRAKWQNNGNDTDQRFLVQNLGKTFFRSEYWSASWNIYSNGTPTLDEVVVGLYTQKTLSNTIAGTSGDNKVNGSGFDTDGVKVGAIIGDNTAQWRTVTAVTATQLTVDRNWAASFSAVAGIALIPQATRMPQTNLALSTADQFQKGTVLTDADLDTSLDVYFVVVMRDIIDTTTFPFVDAISLNSGQESAGYQRAVDNYESNYAGTSENFDTQPTSGSSSGGAQPPGGGGTEPGEILPISW